MSEIDCSVIVPVYYNEESVAKTYEALQGSVFARHPQLRFETIFVDDGSGDGSLARLLALREAHPRDVRVIKFTRNFGQIAAIRAGYARARGRCAVNISADLQDDPDLINQMLAGHFGEGYEIVLCARESRRESRFRRATSRIFYGLMRALSFPEMPRGGFDYVLIGDRVRRLVLDQDEANPFWQGQILWTGFPVKQIPYTRERREHGSSRWTFSKKVKYLVDGVLGYSFFPLRVISGLGIAISLLGFGYALAIVVLKLFGNIPIEGWAPLMIAILVLSGIQMLMLGVIGEYLWRTLDQVRGRQRYVIERIFE